MNETPETPLLEKIVGANPAHEVFEKKMREAEQQKDQDMKYNYVFMADPGGVDKETVTHNLKTWPEFFAAVKNGANAFAARKDGRPFDVGDQLCLKEWNPEAQSYTGESIRADVTYVLRGKEHIAEGYYILGLGDVREEKRTIEPPSQEAEPIIICAICDQRQSFKGDKVYCPSCDEEYQKRCSELVKMRATIAEQNSKMEVIKKADAVLPYIAFGYNDPGSIGIYGPNGRRLSNQELEFAINHLNELFESEVAVIRIETKTSETIQEWGVEEFDGMLFVGPMRASGEKLNEVVFSISIEGLKDDATALARTRCKAIAAAMTYAGPQSDLIRKLESEASSRDAEIQTIQRYIREAVDPDAIDGSAPAECVALIISQRDNARNEADTLRTQLTNAEAREKVLREALDLAIGAFHRYEMDVDDSPTREHVEMVKKLYTALNPKD